MASRQNSKWMKYPGISVYLRKQHVFTDIPAIVIANAQAEPLGKGYFKSFMRLLGECYHNDFVLYGKTTKAMFVYVENVLNPRFAAHLEKKWEKVTLAGGLQTDFFMPAMDISEKYS